MASCNRKLAKMKNGKTKQISVKAIVERYLQSSAIKQAILPHQPKLIIREWFAEYGGDKARNGRALEMALYCTLEKIGREIRMHVQLKPPNPAYGRQKGWEMDLVLLPTRLLPPMVIGCKVSLRERGKEGFGLTSHLAVAYQYMSIFQRKMPILYLVTRQEDQRQIEDKESAIELCRCNQYWWSFPNDPAQLITVLDDEKMEKLFREAGWE